MALRKSGRLRTGGGGRAWSVKMYGPPAREHGVYRVKWRAEDPACPGKVVWRSRAAQTRREADRIFDEIERHVDAVESGATEVEDATIGDLADRWIQKRVLALHHGDLSQSSFRNDETIVRLWLKPFMGDRRVREWTPDLSQALIDHCITRNKQDLGSVRSVLRGITNEGRESPVVLQYWQDPLRGLSLRTRSRQRHGSRNYVPVADRPTTAMVETVRVCLEEIAAAKTRGPKITYAGLMLDVAAYGALRFGEETALTVRDWDPDLRELTVSKAHHEDRPGPVYVGPVKNRRTREVAVPRSIAERLDKRVAEVGDPDGLLFPNPRGNPWRKGTWARSFWVPAATAAGLVVPGDDGQRLRYTWHSWRHHAATWLHEVGGLPWPDVSRILGHADVGFTLSVYVHPGADSRESARAALADL